MDILQNREQWTAEFRAGWLAYWQATGGFDWNRYPSPKNEPPSPSPGIDLRTSRLLFISTAGGYLKGLQTPFDAANPLGDYSLRTFPTDTPFADLDYDHDHYDTTAVTADPQVLLPLRHLQQMVDQGIIGELASSVISYMGYQPDIARVIDELIPAIQAEAKEQQVQAVLLVPA